MNERTTGKERWRRGALWTAALLAGLLLMPQSGAAQGKKKTEAKEDYSKHAGYVDFASMGLFGEEEAVVEIYLHDALLSMVASMSKNADPELSDMLGKLKLVRVQKFRLADTKLSAVESKVSDLAGKLEKGGWVCAVRVREENDNVYVYFKMGEKLLSGITVMAVENAETATFVNIVGDIDPEQIGRLGKKFDIDELHDLKDWEKSAKDKARDEDKEKPEKK